MNPEIKKKWLEALRSGQYRQTKERLRDDSGYCCLGVLCDLHSKDTGVEWNEGINAYGTARFRYYNCGGELPEHVIRWAGLAIADPIIAPYKESDVTASHANDNGFDFRWIADKIEANL